MKFKNFFNNNYFSKICFFIAIILLTILLVNPYEIFSYFPKKLLLLISFLFAVSYLSIFINKQIDIYISIITMVYFSIFITELYLAYKNYIHYNKSVF